MLDCEVPVYNVRMRLLRMIEVATKPGGLSNTMTRWAAALLQRTGQDQPATDLTKAASRLGASIQHAELSCPARLLYSHGASRIVVDSGSPTGEQRFSIAHELGHIMIRNALRHLVQDEKELKLMFRVGASERLEQACDTFAAELLIPGQWLRKELRESKLRGMALATWLAEERFGASIAATTQRMVHIGLPYLVLRFTERALPGKELKLRLESVVAARGRGRPFMPRHKVAPPGSIVNRAYRSSSNQASGWENLSFLNVAGHEYWIECVRGASGVLALVHLDVARPAQVPSRSGLNGKHELKAIERLLSNQAKKHAPSDVSGRDP